MRFKTISYNGINPIINANAYVAEGCVIAGDVNIASGANIWFNSVLRGDVAKIVIGRDTNIQDGCIIHTSRFDGPTIIGSNVTVGHMALLHACTIEDNAFIGMRATIMDYSEVAEYGFVAAGALVTPNKKIKSRELWAGVPAKFVRYITDAELSHMESTVHNYLKLAASYKTH